MHFENRYAYNWAVKTNDAINFFGSESALAKALGIKPSSVYDWRDVVPDLRQLQLESLTHGELKADERLKPPALRQQAAE